VLQQCFHPILAIFNQRGAKYQKYSLKESSIFKVINLTAAGFWLLVTGGLSLAVGHRPLVSCHHYHWFLATWLWVGQQPEASSQWQDYVSYNIFGGYNTRYFR
jgi:hypothetical protein